MTPIAPAPASASMWNLPSRISPGRTLETYQAHASSSRSATRSELARGQIVELDDGVGLRPHADLAGVGERLVLLGHHVLVVEVDGEEVSLRLDAELVPDAARDLSAPRRELPALAVLDVIEAHVSARRRSRRRPSRSSSIDSAY